MSWRTTTREWRAIVRHVREVGRASDLPCGICHGARGPIDYRTQAEADRDARANGEWWLIGQHRPLALSVDHIIPWSAGGTDSLDNAAPSHAVCNAGAGAKGTPKRRSKPPQTAVIGHWKPHDGNGDALPGRAVPGTRQGRYVFVADPPQVTRMAAPPPSPTGIGRTSGSPRPPRRPRNE